MRFQPELGVHVAKNRKQTNETGQGPKPTKQDPSLPTQASQLSHKRYNHSETARKSSSVKLRKVRQIA